MKRITCLLLAAATGCASGRKSALPAASAQSLSGELDKGGADLYSATWSAPGRISIEAGGPCAPRIEIVEGPATKPALKGNSAEVLVVGRRPLKFRVIAAETGSYQLQLHPTPDRLEAPDPQAPRQYVFADPVFRYCTISAPPLRVRFTIWSMLAWSISSVKGIPATVV